MEQRVEEVSRPDAIYSAPAFSTISKTLVGNKQPRASRHAAERGDAQKKTENGSPRARQAKLVPVASRSFSRPRVLRRQPRQSACKPLLPIVKTASPPPQPPPFSLPALAARRGAKDVRSQRLRLTQLAKVNQSEPYVSAGRKLTSDDGLHPTHGQQPLPALKKVPKGDSRRLCSRGGTGSDVEKRKTNSRSFFTENPRTSFSTSLMKPPVSQTTTKPVTSRPRTATLTLVKSKSKNPDRPVEESSADDAQTEAPPLTPGAKHLAHITTALRAIPQPTQPPVSHIVPPWPSLPRAVVNTNCIFANPHFTKRTSKAPAAETALTKPSLKSIEYVSPQGCPNDARQPAGCSGWETPQAAIGRADRQSSRRTLPLITATDAGVRGEERRADGARQERKINGEHRSPAGSVEDSPQSGVRCMLRKQGRPGVLHSVEIGSVAVHSICLPVSQNIRQLPSGNFLPSGTFLNQVYGNIMNNAFKSFATMAPNIKPNKSGKNCSTVPSVLQIAPPCTPADTTKSRRKKKTRKITPSSKDKKETLGFNVDSTNMSSMRPSSGSTRRKITPKKSSRSRSRSSSNALGIKKFHQDRKRISILALSNSKRSSQVLVNSKRNSVRSPTIETSEGCTVVLSSASPSTSIATSSTRPRLQSANGTTDIPITSKPELAAQPSAPNGSDAPKRSRLPSPRRTIAWAPHRSLGRDRLRALRRLAPPSGAAVMPSDVPVVPRAPAPPPPTPGDLTARSSKTTEAFVKHARSREESGSFISKYSFTEII